MRRERSISESKMSLSPSLSPGVVRIAATMPWRLIGGGCSFSYVLCPEGGDRRVWTFVAVKVLKRERRRPDPSEHAGNVNTHCRGSRVRRRFREIALSRRGAQDARCLAHGGLGVSLLHQFSPIN